ncbi:MAG: hypothetical protein Q9208_007259 [Pyrenodesmia sp. 3 TL-2023]
MVDRMRIQRKSLKDQDKVRAEVVDFFRVLQLVLDPLAVQMRHLRRQVNMDDLLRKLKWYTALFKQIFETDLFTVANKATFHRFEADVNELLRRQGISNNEFTSTPGLMPVIPPAGLKKRGVRPVAFFTRESDTNVNGPVSVPGQHKG